MAKSKFVNIKLRETILEKLKEGHFEKTVLDYVGLSSASYYEWLRRGEEEQDDESSEYARFATQVKKAKAEAEFQALGHITKAGNDQWQAAAWFLERTRSDRFAKAEWRLSKLQGKKDDDDFVIDLSEGDKDDNNPPLPGH